MRIRIYLDGLNFYYGIARAHRCKWLDLPALFSKLLKQKLPSHGDLEIEKLIVFSSIVMEDERVYGMTARGRQEVYYDALKKHDHRVEICLGQFQESVKIGRVISGEKKGEVVVVLIREEKQTDVNLACRIVDDAHSKLSGEIQSYDMPCVVTNDGDIAPALKMLNKLKQDHILIMPRASGGNKKPSMPSWTLKKETKKALRISEISKDLLEDSLLPAQVEEFSLPPAPGWYASKPD